MGKTVLIVATSSGIVICERVSNGWQPLRGGLNGQHVASVIAREGVILAGTRDGVFRSEDAGQTWQEASQGLAIRHVRWMAYHPQLLDREFAGTEPAGIFVSQGGGEQWRACPEVEQLRDEYGWSLPYSPAAGCVRGFAFHGERAYAAVEVGGALVSNDTGQTWGLANGSTFRRGFPPAGSVHPDVHSIETHPSSPDLIYAPTGGGFYRSRDGGTTWELRYRSYCRAVWVDPGDPDHLVLGPADGVDTNGRIESTRDGGRSWQPAFAGLEVPWRRHMVERFKQIDDKLMAVLSNGELLSAPLQTLDWKYVPLNSGRVNAIAWLAV